MSNFPAHFNRHMIIPTAIESINEVVQNKFASSDNNATGNGWREPFPVASPDIPP